MAEKWMNSQLSSDTTWCRIISHKARI